jgi:hypothetical protein
VVPLNSVIVWLEKGKGTTGYSLEKAKVYA